MNSYMFSADEQELRSGPSVEKEKNPYALLWGLY